MMNRKLFLGILFLAAFAHYCTNTVKGSDYYKPKALATHFNGEEYVGSMTCLECHADIYASHIQTAHYNTSATANAENIKGSFKRGENTLDIGDMEVVMLKEGKSFYQHTKLNDADNQSRPEKINIVIGSGVKGQSYLTWEGEKLFQLQASYYPPTDHWINSPGYPPHSIKRPIRDGCLKCHVTFATNRDFSGQGNQYDKARMVYGVDCEKCHRPSAKHVIYHREHPEDKASKFMLKLDTLSRQQRLDACAQCHSGPRDRLLQGNSFSYLVGENLDEYSRNFHSQLKNSELDVHGNQYGLLTSSECFKQTATLDCSTCHDPHKNQRGSTGYFNQKCISCHNTNAAVCSAEAATMQTMANNCIACHMPNTPSKAMSVQLTNSSVETSVYVRTHLIGVYPQELWHD